jgi:hypothetical protein
VSDRTAVLGEVVGFSARRAREAESCDALVGRSGRAEPIAWRYGAPSASPTVCMARLPHCTVVLSIAGPPRKEKSKRDKKSEGNGTIRAPYPSQQKLTYSGPKTVEEWGTLHTSLKTDQQNNIPTPLLACRMGELWWLIYAESG